MTRLTILEFPDPRLRTRATPVAQVDAPLRDLIDDMLETMYAANGIGLAATQVNVHRRLLVADVSEGRNEPRVYINPEILDRTGTETMQEGCLSVPGYFDEVQRAERIRVRAQDRDGKSFEEDLDGLLAVCVQHEIDHLDGKLFVDYLSEMKRQRVRKKLEKERKLRAEGRAPEASRAPAI
ncbi:MAG TPA: peptide deformylase [Steroidobacteraceae bacterium]|jgi:peptide deformylase|nr:peptide deformylase [Steroidobacteraceae bacterium]